MKRQSRASPCTSLGWYKHYRDQFNKTESPDAMYLAQLNLLFYLAFGEDCQAA